MTQRARIRVLVADDNADLRDALALLIESREHLELAAIAGNADEAIELAARERPDVALVDVRMPGGGGVAAARGIVALSPETAIIALSAEGVLPADLEPLVADSVAKGSPIEDILGAIEKYA